MRSNDTSFQQCLAIYHDLRASTWRAKWEHQSSSEVEQVTQVPKDKGKHSLPQRRAQPKY